MTDHPGPDTTGALAAWLAAHMARTGRPAEAVAAELGVSTATVRSWLAGHRAAAVSAKFAANRRDMTSNAAAIARKAVNGVNVCRVALTLHSEGSGMPPGVAGGKPSAGSVTNTPAPMSAAPKTM